MAKIDIDCGSAGHEPMLFDLYTNQHDGGEEVVYMLVEVMGIAADGCSKKRYCAICVSDPGGRQHRTATDDKASAAVGLRRLAAGSSVTITQE